MRTINWIFWASAIVATCMFSTAKSAEVFCDTCVQNTKGSNRVDDRIEHGINAAVATDESTPVFFDFRHDCTALDILGFVAEFEEQEIGTATYVDTDPEMLTAIFDIADYDKFSGLLNGFGLLTQKPVLEPLSCDIEFVGLVKPMAPLLDVSTAAIQARESGGRDGYTSSVHAQSIYGRGVNIAIVDAGVDNTLGDFDGLFSFKGGFDATNFEDPDGDGVDNDPQGTARFEPADGSTDPVSTDAGQHGTRVALIAMSSGQPGEGSSCSRPASCTGVAPKAGLFDVKVCTCPTPRCIDPDCSPDDVLEGLRWIEEYNASTERREDKIHIANISLGDSCGDPYGNHPVSRRVNRLVNSGVVVVAGFGNAGELERGTICRVPPGAASLAITVAGSDDRGTIQRGDDIVMYNSLCGSPNEPDKKPNVSAPARLIGFPFFRNPSSGTSFATPHVSGTAALLLEANGNLKPLEIKPIIEQTADNDFDRWQKNRYCPRRMRSEDWDPAFGHGIVNAVDALEAVRQPKIQP